MRVVRLKNPAAKNCRPAACAETELAATQSQSEGNDLLHEHSCKSAKVLMLSLSLSTQLHLGQVSGGSAVRKGCNETLAKSARFDHCAQWQLRRKLMKTQEHL